MSKPKLIIVYVLSDTDGNLIYSTNINSLCEIIREKANYWDYDNCSLRFKINKTLMTAEQIDKLPEFNG